MRHPILLLFILSACGTLGPAAERELLLDDLEAAADAVERLGNAEAAAVARAVQAAVDEARKDPEQEAVLVLVGAVEAGLPELRETLAEQIGTAEAEVAVQVLGRALRRLAAHLEATG